MREAIITTLAAAMLWLPAHAQDDPPTDGAGTPTHVYTLEDLGLQDGEWMTGYPSYASFTVPLPQDSALQDPRLRIVAAQQMVGSANASLRVSVNGRTAYAGLLQPGAETLDLDLPLRAADVAGLTLQVSLALTGDLPQDLCHDQRSMSIALRLLPETGLAARLDAPVRSVRDAWALLPTDLALVLPAAPLTREWFETATFVAAHLTRAGFAVHVTDPAGAGEFPARARLYLGDDQALIAAGLTPADAIDRADPLALWRDGDDRVLAVVEAGHQGAGRFLVSVLTPVAGAASVDPATVPPGLADGGEVPLRVYGLDTGISRTATRRRWTVPFALADLPGGAVPVAALLDLRAPVAGGDTAQYAHVSFNGKILSSTAVAGGPADLLEVPIPQRLLRTRNTLQVEFLRDEHRPGCTTGRPRFPVQLADDSVLTVGSEPLVEAGFVPLPGAYAGGVDVVIDDGVLAAPTAPLRLLSSVLAAFVPARADIGFLWIEDGPPPAPTRPFIAYGMAARPDASTVSLEEGRLHVTDGAGATVIEVAQVGPLSVLQALTVDGQPGLAVLGHGDSPGVTGIAFGWYPTALIPRDGNALVLAPDGTPDSAARIVRAISDDDS